MSSLTKRVMLRAIKFINLLLITGLFAGCWYIYYHRRITVPFYRWGAVLVIVLYFILYAMCTKVYDSLWVSHFRISTMIYSQNLAFLVTNVVAYIVICLLSQKIANVIPLLILMVAQSFAATVWALLAHIWYYRTFPPKRTAIIYDEYSGMEELISEYGLEKKFRIELIEDVHKCIDDLSVLDGMQAVFVRGVHSHERNIILKYCIAHSIKLYVIPRVGDVLMSSAKPVHMFHLPMLTVGRYDPSLAYLFIKRAFDILVSSVAIIALSPILIVTSIAIKLCDHGPVIYKQCRLTKNGKKFNVYKFRSMRVDAEKDGVARLSTGENDDRITPVGRVIRKVRIDELPQLFNILFGSMTIVGPRPERPEIAAQYEEKLPEFSLRLQAKAGLTGYAQVYGKYNTTPYNKLLMDLTYISKASISQDLHIMFATVKILFMPESTEGIKEGEITADRSDPDRPDRGV